MATSVRAAVRRQPAGRARLTMELVRGAAAPRIRLDDRREIGYGQWEGLTLPEMAA
jgi:probable phosphoglycerate mutase